MHVMKNPVLSKMYAHSGLALSDKGLHFYIKDDPCYNILVTTDYVRIAEIMGFNFQEFDAAKEYDEFFKLLLTNQFFRPSRFVVDNTEGEVKMFAALAEFLTTNPIYKGYTTRQVTDMFEPLKEFDFEARYKRLFVLQANAKAIRTKFNGGTVLRLKPDFDKRNLEAGFDKFNNGHFTSSVERLEFIYSHTEEEIVEEFVKL